MHLVDAERSAYLYDRMPAEKRMISGGSSANTAAGVANLGGYAAAFVGKVAEDDLGEFFRDDFREIGVHYSHRAAPRRPGHRPLDDPRFPGGERTMNTYLGACQQLTSADIKEEEIGAGLVTYMEGYLWDPPEAKKAFVTAAHYAHRHERPTAITLCDPFCVNRYRDEFLDLMRSQDHRFRLRQHRGGEGALSNRQSQRRPCSRSPRTANSLPSPWALQGAMAVHEGEVVTVPAFLGGCGGRCHLCRRSFASGFLLAPRPRPRFWRTALAAGCLAASEVISHIGAQADPRPSGRWRGSTASRSRRGAASPLRRCDAGLLEDERGAPW